jgi:hypothetical protein
MEEPCRPPTAARRARVAEADPGAGPLSPRYLALLLAITVGALALRLHNLADWGMWIDELYTVMRAAEVAGGAVHARTFAYWPAGAPWSVEPVGGVSPGSRK